MFEIGNSTVGEIVAEDFRAAAVFHQFGIDFCCGGEKTLAEACLARNVKVADVLSELERTWLKPSAGTPRFDHWELSTLIAYIVSNHHGYVRKVLPSIVAHTQKLAKSHGANRPELTEIMRLFESIADEMTSHMAKEERVLFPYITAIENAAAESLPVPPAPFGSIDNPIRMMEHEHESAGAAMKRIRELSGGYTVPDGACTTYRICFKELEAFEQDLHEHVHLENNILFPKARAIAPSFA